MDKEEKTVIKIAIVIVLFICVISVFIFFSKDKITKKSEFVIPQMEQNVVEGKPSDVPKKLMYSEVKVNDNYIVYLSGVPMVKNNILTLYFTSVKTNVGLIKIKVFDSNTKLLGESGLISPNNYIKDITLNRELKDNEKITIKVMNYEEDTYYSLGSIKLDVFVKKD